MTGTLRGHPVTIVGAGIAGLSAAVALAQRGAKVTISERADAPREVGAGIQLSANAMRVIAALGLSDQLREVSRQNAAVVLYDSAGTQVLRLDLARHRPGHEFRLIHRARLIGLLAAAAYRAGVQINFGEKVSAPPDSPLIIGADGLQSIIRPILNGPETPFFTRQTAWRALIPDETGAEQVQLFMGPGRHLVSYPLADGVRNIVAVQERLDWQDEGWSHKDDPAALRAAFAGFKGPVPHWLDAVTETHIWGLFRHEVAARWQDGRHVLIGDAAHPTLPFMAQGAALALEDAWILAACLDQFADRRIALARYEALRKPRVSQVVAVANNNARNYHLSGAKGLAAHMILRSVGRIAPARMLARYDWIYDYNPLTVEI